MKQDQYILLIWELLHCSTYQLVLEIIHASTIAQTSAAKETDTLHVGSNNDKKEEPIKKPSNIKYGDSIGDNSKSYKSSKSDNSDESNEEDKPEKVSSLWIVIACVFGALIGCIIGVVSLTKGGGDDIIVEDTVVCDEYTVVWDVDSADVDTACTVAAVGAAMRGTAECRIAPTTAPAAGATSSGCALPYRLRGIHFIY